MRSSRQNRPGSPRHLTPKGLNTRASLLESAREVFKDKGYYTASVSEISRHCGVSQGTFYQYFRNKEQVFQELSDQIITRFWERAASLPEQGPAFEGRLRQVLGLLLDHMRDNHYFHRILGEFELIDPVTIGYYDSIARCFRGFFREEAARGSIRFFDPNLISYGLIGMAYFHSMDWGPGEEEYSPDRLIDLTAELIRRGISGPRPWARPKDPSASAFPDRTESSVPPETGVTQGQMTRRAIFQAAEEIFGRYGFNRANVSEITRRAGVAQGTFYVHFKSKRDLMEGVVRYLSHELRRTLKMATEKTEDRRAAEQEGMLAFFRFLRPHAQIYRVVAESETLGRKVGMWYYKKLAAGYITGLGQGVEKGQIRDLPVVFTVRSLMGFNHMIGLKWMVWNSSPQAELPKQLLGEAVRIVLDGLDPV